MAQISTTNSKKDIPNPCAPNTPDNPNKTADKNNSNTQKAQPSQHPTIKTIAVNVS